MMVTGALSDPMIMSGNASGFINSAGGTVSAKARLPKGDSAVVPRAAAAKATMAALWQNSRRLISKIDSVGLKIPEGSAGEWASATWLAGYNNCGNGRPP